MLNESYRIDAGQKIEQMNLLASPNYEQQDRQELFRQYQERAEDLLLEDIIPKEDGGWGGIEEALR